MKQNKRDFMNFIPNYMYTCIFIELDMQIVIHFTNFQ